jgi:hypothetical protein
MKRILPLLFFLTATLGFAQVGVNTTIPDPSSMLDVSATNKGVLVPRVSLPNVTTTMLDGTNTAATGLLIWNTNAATVGGNGVGFYFFNGTQWMPITQTATSDHDIYEVGGTTAPDAITDNKYTQGSLTIGTNTAATGVLDIDNATKSTSLDISNTNTTDPIGVKIELNSLNSTKTGIDILLDGTNPSGGFSNFIHGEDKCINTQNSAGLYQVFDGSTSSTVYNKMGIYNDFLYTSNYQGIITGVYNSIYNNSNGYTYGTNNSITGFGSGNKYGSYNFITPVAGGTHYGVYSEVLKAGSYAGYFLGNVGIGTSPINNYILPPSRGTNGQTMQTDGSGNVSWVTPTVSTDHDIYEVGSTTAPDAITDNKFTQGTLTIGTNTAATGVFDIDNSTKATSVDINNTFATNPTGIDLNLTSNAAGKTGIKTQFNGTAATGTNSFIQNTDNMVGNTNRTAISNDFSGTSSSISTSITGLKNDFKSTSNYYAILYGVNNSFASTTNAWNYGMSNTFTNGGSTPSFGVVNSFNGTSTGNATGILNSSNNYIGQITGIDNSFSGTGNGIHYGVSNILTGTGTGDKYGTYNYIPTSAGGVQYGVYSDVLKSGSYAGYFVGNVSIGTSALNNYILPSSRGTANQIMQTDGLGNVTWVNPPTDTDDQTTDVFSLTGNTLNLSLQNDGVATQTVDLSPLKDHDWYEIGGTIQPDAITDNKYTLGNVTIGSNSLATGIFDVDNSSKPISLDVTNSYTTSPTGIDVKLNSASSSKVGLNIDFKGTNTSSISSFINNRDECVTSSNFFGIYQAFVGSNTSTSNGTVGIRNWFATSSGYQGSITGTSNEIFNNLNGIHYGNYNYLTGTGIGAKYGTYNFIDNSAGGTHYGLYSEVLKAGSYAGYFLGRVSIGTTLANNYILPGGRGANGQIMQTDGSGNVSWVNPVDTDTDNQQIDVLGLVGDTLTISLQDDAVATQTLSLSAIDNQATDVFSLTGTTLNLSLQNDGVATQTVDLSSLKDADWYEVGGTNSPDAITDNKFTLGDISIGKITAASGKLDVDAALKNITTSFTSNNTTTGSKWGILNNVTLDTTNPNSYGIANSVSGNAGFKYGIYNTLSGAVTGTTSEYALVNNHNSSGNVNGFGVYNSFNPAATNSGSYTGLYNETSGTNHTGAFTGVNNIASNTSANPITGISNTLSGLGTGIRTGINNNISGGLIGNSYGVNNTITSVGGTKYGIYSNLNAPGVKYGVYNDLISSAGSGPVSYGVYNKVTNPGGSLGSHYGIYNEMLAFDNQYGTYTTMPSVTNYPQYGNYVTIAGGGTGNRYGFYSTISSFAGGTHYGIYSDVTKAGSYAGYFLGNVSIGTSIGNEYILPTSRGTNGQIMQTDGSGNVSWVNNSASDADWYEVGGLTPADSILDNIFTGGDVSIGKATAATGKVDIEADNKTSTLVLENNNASSGSKSGIDNSLTANANNALSWGILNRISGLSSLKFGVTNSFTNNNPGASITEVGYNNDYTSTGNVNFVGHSNTIFPFSTNSGTITGYVNNVTGSVTGEFTGFVNSNTVTTNSLKTGLMNVFYGGGNGDTHGINNSFTGITNGEIIGVTTTINSPGTGLKFGERIIIDNTSGGIHCGIYSDVTKANSYAGYFLGRVSIGNTLANNYILPASRGTNGQIMQTDGAGNVSWTNAPTADADWYEVGGTNPANAITDNIFTSGDVSIGKNTAATAKVDIDANTKLNTLALENLGATVGTKNGISNSVQANANNANSSAILNAISGLAVVKYGVNNGFLTNNLGANIAEYGTNNNFFSSGNVSMMGTNNNFAPSGTNSSLFTGVRNSLSSNNHTGLFVGLANYISNTTNSQQYGVFNSFYGGGAGIRYGVRNDMGGNSTSNIYGTYTEITSTGAGNKYGEIITIDNTSPGTHYGIYADVTKATSYAGYFLGRVSIGTTTADNYILPTSRGTANQIMQTDGAGNVTWINPTTIAPVGWKIAGNAGTIAGSDYIGTNDAQDFDFRTNNVLKLRLTQQGQLAFLNSGGSVFVGAGAGDVDDLTNNQNTFIGTSSGQLTTIGNLNTAIGHSSLSANVDGLGNTAVGRSALAANVSGSNNTSIGRLSDVSVGTLTNATAVGFSATVNASNKVRLGSATVTVVEGQVPYTNPSDARFKFNVKEDVPGLDFIKKLKPVTYNFDTKKFDEHLNKNRNRDEVANEDFTKSTAIIRTGFLAQDVEKICNDLGYNFDGLHIPDANNPTDNYGIAYSQFIMPIVKAVQEQQVIIENQKTELEQLKSELEKYKSLEERIKALENK